MSFTERTIFPTPLKFVEMETCVQIGANYISKDLYNKFKPEFDLIIKLGDLGWNTRLTESELVKMAVNLELRKQSKACSINNLTLDQCAECKGDNMNMKELAKQEEIKNGFDNIPVGMTKLQADSIQIEPIEVEFNGVKKTRYELNAKTTEGKEVNFCCGVQIYNGLIALAKQGNIKTIYITRNGTTKEDTKYTVAGE
jgi:hypothetical protein